MAVGVAVGASVATGTGVSVAAGTGVSAASSWRSAAAAWSSWQRRATVAALHLSDDPDAQAVRSSWVLAGRHPPQD